MDCTVPWPAVALRASSPITGPLNPRQRRNYCFSLPTPSAAKGVFVHHATTYEVVTCVMNSGMLDREATYWQAAALKNVSF